jgi:DNA-binding transcriptional regulator YdaS (Cro superfamily)
MNLSSYFEIPGNTQVDLAQRVGISQSMISQISTGLRPCPIPTCVAIERETGGSVTRKDLRPDDWQEIWPELGDDRRHKTDRRTNRRGTAK